MAWRPLILIALMLIACATAKARADECRNPDALGTSRVMTIEPRQFPRIGQVQYSHTLPLGDKEVVLTFDDGPLPPYSARVLDILAEHCVKANYFLVGRMSRGYADLVRRIHAEGHTIGTHSENHLLGFDRAPIATVKNEIEQGIASVGTALRDPRAVAPFFRIPGFLRHHEVEAYLQSRGLVTWSADVVADDWKHITAFEIVRRTITRLEEKRKGIVLLHDIQPATALALPELLRELKLRGFRIVHVVPARGIAPAPAPVAEKPAEPVPAAAVAQAAPTPVALTQPAAATGPAPAVAPQPREQPAEAKAPVQAEKKSDVQLEKKAEVQPERPETSKLAVPVEAAESLARGEAIVHDPVRPLTSGAKPARSMSTPGKFITTEPGGWPPVVGVPVPRAGGVGVSTLPRSGRTPDGRFQ